MSSAELNCIICKKSNNNQNLYGEWRQFQHKNRTYSLHHFCMMFLSTLIQEEDLSAGIDGFLVENVLRCAKKHDNVACYYCSGNSASVRCEDPLCARYFHMACGVDNQCILQFRGEFKAYCDLHHGIAKLDFLPLGCWICDGLLAIENVNVPSIVPSCCNQRVYFHRVCMQQYAFESGSFMLCPCCGGKENRARYLDLLRDRGIYIPIRAATWDREENYDMESGENILECSADSCTASLNENGDDWTLEVCVLCGSNAIHSKCLASNNSAEPFICSSCDSVEKRSTTFTDSISNTNESHLNNNDELLGFTVFEEKRAEDRFNSSNHHLSF